MYFRLAASVWVSLVISVVVPAQAQDRSRAPTMSLSLQQALALAEKMAPNVVLASRMVREARATRVGAGVRLPVNPRLSGEVRPGVTRSARGELGYAALLDVLIEVADAAGSRIKESNRRVELAKRELELIRLEARLAVLRAYVFAKIAALRSTQIGDAIRVAERVLSAAKERLKSGAGTDIDVTSAQSELSERRAQFYSAEAQRIEAEVDLRYLLQRPIHEPIHLTSAVDTTRPPPTIVALMREARRRHPELKIIRSKLKLLNASEERLRREAFPKVGLFAGIDAAPQSPHFGIAGLSIELPVAQRNQGPRAVIEAEKNTETARLSLEGRRIENQILAAHQMYELNRRENEELQKEGIPAASKRLELVETGWRHGRFDIFRWTTAAQGLIRLKNMWLDSLERIWLERINLERTVGGWPK